MVRRNLGLPHRLISKNFNCVIWVNNSIGTFHEQILGGIDGFEVGKLSGFDIKAKDESLFADIKNKHNTMNSSSAEALFQKLARYADTYKKSKCYWVQILAKNRSNRPI